MSLRRVARIQLGAELALVAAWSLGTWWLEEAAAGKSDAHGATPLILFLVALAWGLALLAAVSLPMPSDANSQAVRALFVGGLLIVGAGMVMQTLRESLELPTLLAPWCILAWWIGVARCLGARARSAGRLRLAKAWTWAWTGLPLPILTLAVLPGTRVEPLPGLPAPILVWVTARLVLLLLTDDEQAVRADGPVPPSSARV